MISMQPHSVPAQQKAGIDALSGRPAATAPVTEGTTAGATAARHPDARHSEAQHTAAQRTEGSPTASKQGASGSPDAAKSRATGPGHREMQHPGTADSPGAATVDSLPAGADSAARAQADSLAFRNDSVCFMQGDSLVHARLGEWPVPEEPSPAVAWRDTTVTALFGQESCTVQPERLERPVGESLTDNAVFQGFVLVLAATYATLLYRNLGDVKTLLSRISRDTASSKPISEEPGSNGFSRFLNVATAIGMLFMGVIVVKYGDTLMPLNLGQTLSHGAVLALSLLATLAWCGVVIFQASLIRITGAITLSQPFISQLVLLRRTYFSLAVIITSPTLLLFALCPRGTGGAWFIVGAVELIITAVLYLRESLNLFISKKISILLWILYLCTVEVFPISLLWLLAAR